jgi:uncharacterized membrane protein YdjX (TVP38/TMEM64 family)
LTRAFPGGHTGLFMESLAKPASRRWKKKHLLLAAGVAAVGVVALAVAWRFEMRAFVEAVIVALREAGPGVFFVAMALLPAMGFPLMAFTLAAGPVFGPTMGTGWVIVWSLTAVMVNLLLSYWLANRALRPLVGRVLATFEVRLPEASAGGAWQLALIVRLTPGLPYWAQSYVLGLVGVPLVPYLVVSMLVMAGFIVAIVAGGDAMVQGNGRMVVAAAGLLVVSVAGLQWMRKRSAQRLAGAAVRD